MALYRTTPDGNVEMTAEEEAAHLADQSLLHAENLARMAASARRGAMPSAEEHLEAILAGGDKLVALKEKIAQVEIDHPKVTEAAVSAK